MTPDKHLGPALLVMGVLSGSLRAHDRAQSRTKEIFGPLISSSSPKPFNRFSSYYEHEMGPELIKSYWVFARQVYRGCLVDAKLATNRIERDMSLAGKRTVNLDPGLLAAESLILATTKPYSHRVYLSKGIYAELVCTFRKDGGLDLMPWAYPDYRDPETMDFFGSIRKEVLLS